MFCKVNNLSICMSRLHCFRVNKPTDASPLLGMHPFHHLKPGPQKRIIRTLTRINVGRTKKWWQFLQPKTLVEKKTSSCFHLKRKTLFVLLLFDFSEYWLTPNRHRLGDLFWGWCEVIIKQPQRFSGDAFVHQNSYILFFRMSCHRIPNAFWCDLLGIHWDTPPKFNSSGPEKLPKPKRRVVFQPFIFSGELWNFAVYNIRGWRIWQRIPMSGPDFQSQSTVVYFGCGPFPVTVANKGL